jgi:large-conductance mechanosensitive channel
MDPTGNTFTSEDPRKWIGRIIMAVILGEAIWNLIVSVMNNLVVPWLGDLFGQSSGLPTSFTQRPYNYPDLFVSILEFCIAALVAAIINYFFQRPRAVRVKTMKSAAPIAPVEPLRIVPQVAAPGPIPQPAPTQSLTPQIPIPQPATPQPAMTPPGMTMTKTAVTQTTPPAPVTKPVPVAAAPPVTVAAPMPAPPVVTPAPVVPAAAAKPVAVAPTAPSLPASAAKSQPPPPPKAQPAKATKTKQVYYNIVGEPMPSDDE